MKGDSYTGGGPACEACGVKGGCKQEGKVQGKRGQVEGAVVSSRVSYRI